MESESSDPVHVVRDPQVGTSVPPPPSITVPSSAPPPQSSVPLDHPNTSNAQSKFGSSVICRTPARPSSLAAGQPRPASQNNRSLQQAAWKNVFGSARAAAAKRSADHLTSTTTQPKRTCDNLRDPRYLEGQTLEVAAILRNNTRRQLVNELSEENSEVPLSTSWMDERLEHSQLPSTPQNITNNDQEHIL